MERVGMPQNQQSKCLIFKKKKSYFINEIIPVLFNKPTKYYTFFYYTHTFIVEDFLFFISLFFFKFD